MQISPLTSITMRCIVLCKERYLGKGMQNGYSAQARAARCVRARGDQAGRLLRLQDHQGHEAVCGAFRIDPIPHSAKIEAAQLLSVHSAEHNGRLRKYYHITEQGQKRLEYFKAEWNEIVSIYEFVTREDKNNA